LRVLKESSKRVAKDLSARLEFRSIIAVFAGNGSDVAGPQVVRNDPRSLLGPAFEGYFSRWSAS
jgi:hypothetical protein